MKMTSRLCSAVAPAILGVLVVALWYRGQLQRSALIAVLIVAVLTTFISVLLAWRNTRHGIRHVETLAVRDGSGGFDEVESIDRPLASPDPEADGPTSEALRIADSPQRRMMEYAALIADTAAAARRRVNEAQMPVHILLTAQFGELNDNQEEMLGAAAGAMSSLEEELAQLETIVNLDRGALTVRRESVHVGDVLQALYPMLAAQAKKEGVRLEFDLEPVLPRVLADAPRLRDALRLALTDDIRYAVPGSTVTVQARSSRDTVTVVVTHGSRHAYAGNILLAARLLDAQGGSLEHADGRTVIVLSRKGATPETAAPRVTK